MMKLGRSQNHPDHIVRFCYLQRVVFTWKTLYILVARETYFINLMIQAHEHDQSWDCERGDSPLCQPLWPKQGVVLDISHAAFKAECLAILYQNNHFQLLEFMCA